MTGLEQLRERLRARIQQLDDDVHQSGSSLMIPGMLAAELEDQRTIRLIDAIEHDIKATEESEGAENDL